MERTLPECRRYERRLGDSELSYFLPSRSDGMNDMYVYSPCAHRNSQRDLPRYLSVIFRAPGALMSQKRLRTAWAIIRLRYPLLASQIAVYDYTDVRFW